MSFESSRRALFNNYSMNVQPYNLHNACQLLWSWAISHVTMAQALLEWTWSCDQRALDIFYGLCRLQPAVFKRCNCIWCKTRMLISTMWVAHFHDQSFASWCIMSRCITTPLIINQGDLDSCRKQGRINRNILVRMRSYFCPLSCFV